jgi:murein DD-endopeptidase MepM/ murein hydrolase activator NlpD
MYPVLADISAILSYQISNKGGGAGNYESTAGWDWGWRTHPVTGEKEKWHNGVDLPAPTGTPIFAPWSGSVSKIWVDDDLNGNALRVNFTDAPPEVRGASFVHMSAFASGVDYVGSTFQAGDVIGYVGSTGRSTGPHLHLTLWGSYSQSVAGSTRSDLDPVPYLMSAGQKKILGAGITGGMLVSAFIIFMFLRRS